MRGYFRSTNEQQRFLEVQYIFFDPPYYGPQNVRMVVIPDDELGWLLYSKPTIAAVMVSN